MVMRCTGICGRDWEDLQLCEYAVEGGTCTAGDGQRDPLGFTAQFVEVHVFFLDVVGAGVLLCGGGVGGRLRRMFR